MHADYTIHDASAEDDALIAHHYLALWDSYGFSRSQHLPDSATIVRAFIDEARHASEFKAFLCRTEGVAVASAACQVRHAPYPEVLQPEVRKIGYIWSLYVAPTHRRRGIARRLMQACTDHLRDIDCTSSILHSSDAAMPLYKSLGFEGTSELRLKLR